MYVDCVHLEHLHQHGRYDLHACGACRAHCVAALKSSTTHGEVWEETRNRIVHEGLLERGVELEGSDI